MKMKVRSIVAAMALVTSLGAFAQEEEKKPDPKFHIYLCFGQSNMAGGENPGPQDMENKAECLWKMATTDMPRQQLKVGDWYLTKPLEGRNISQLRLADFFGWTMLEDMPEGYRVGVINVSVPGCKIELFEEDTYAEYLKTAESWMKSESDKFGGNPYKRLVEAAKIAQKDGVIKGIILHQGESNPNDEQWCNKVKGIYDNLIKDLGLDPKKVPFLAGEMKSAEENGQCAGFNTVVLANLPSVLPNSYIISSKGCKGSRDGFHFVVEGYQEFGRRYGAKMLELQGFEYKEPKKEEAADANEAVAPKADEVKADA